MVVRASTSVGGPLDPKKYTGPTTKISADEFHKKLMAFGPEGPPLDWDPGGFEIDESSISPIKTMRGGGFPAEDAPMTSRPFEMEPEPYESDLGRDPYTGEMIEMPGLREGDGKRWSRGKLLGPEMKGIVGLDGVTRTPEDLAALRSMRSKLDKAHADDVRDVRGGMVLGPYSDRFE